MYPAHKSPLPDKSGRGLLYGLRIEIYGLYMDYEKRESGIFSQN
jgi:hypothetical protein